MPETHTDQPGNRWAAAAVAAGIFLSRIAGLVRERIFAHYFGISLHADVFRAALRMPNVLQNLLGEGTLSASFIPVYSELLGQQRYKEAGRMAGAFFSLLLASMGALILLGVSLAPALVSVFLPGFSGERRELAIICARIIFPMTGALVLSAWALGILNSHRRFFIPYVAPVLWNAAMIAVMVALGERLSAGSLVIALAWGALAGGLIQFAIQLPWVLSLERHLKIRWDLRIAGVREALRNAVPAILGRGVVQIGGYLDLVLASLLSYGAVAALGYAQTLYILPVSLFGMSVAAAELPELSRRRGDAAEILRERVNASLCRIAFFVVPSFMAYLALGDQVVAALYQTGDFTQKDTRLVHWVLSGYTMGLMASTASRLFASSFFALHDTRTPALAALIRVLLSAVVALAIIFPLDGIVVDGKPLGPLGLSWAAGLGAWAEWALLRGKLRRRIGAVGIGARALSRMLLASALGACAARGLILFLSPWHPIPLAAMALGLYSMVYIGWMLILEPADAHLLLSRFLRKR
jgi:putative peptidoglycan lipid II flippase